MYLKISFLMVCAVISLTACTSSNRFDGSSTNQAAENFIPGSASDPESVPYFQQKVGDRVLFEVNQSTLTPEGRIILDGQAIWLMTNTDYTVIIEGHADEQGTREYNLALGARRADEARSYLVSRGVSAGRMQVLSYGKERPIEVCSEESCYARNRRSVTVITSGLTG